MLHWTPFPFVRYTLALCAGILIYRYSSPDTVWVSYTLAILAVVYLMLIWLIPKAFRNQVLGLMGALGLFGLVLIGLLRTEQRTNHLETQHLIHEKDSIRFYQAVIVSARQDRAKSYRLEAEMARIQCGNDWKSTQGRVLLYIQKGPIRPQYGDTLLVHGAPILIAPPANPGEFDFQQYLRDQHIYHQHYLKQSSFLVIGHSIPNPVMAFAVQVGEYAESVLKRTIVSKREYALANALILGIRDDLDSEILRAYGASGAMHVLSVSGLHVGILFVILSRLLGALKRLKRGNYLFAGVIVLILWFYAFVTALSPSVLRAVTMFTFVVIAQAARRQSNLYNTLALSAFILLSYDPYYLFSVGFQLSYLAVLGIVYLTPALTRLWSIPDAYAEYRSWVFWRKLKSGRDYGRWLRSCSDKSLEWLWSVSCVSMAAQIATFPLALYYFHQFPTYFLLANPAVLLLSAFVLPVGLLILVVSWIPGVVEGLGGLEKWIITLLNDAVFLTEKLPHAVIAGIDQSALETGLLYGLILTFILLWATRRFYYLPLSLGIVVILTGLNIRDAWDERTQQMAVLHAIRGHSVVSLVRGNEGVLLADSLFSADEKLFNFHLANFWCEKGITLMPKGVEKRREAFVRSQGPVSMWVWNQKVFLFINGPVAGAQLHLPYHSIDYLIIGQNSVKDLKKLIENVAVKQIVVDASNKPYRSNQLRTQAAALAIPFYDLARQKALVIL